MPGQHKFVAANVVGGDPICEHCGDSKTVLDESRVNGKLLPCPDATQMPGNHKFVAANVVGGDPICERCGGRKTVLDESRVDGKLRPCPDAPPESPPNIGRPKGKG